MKTRFVAYVPGRTRASSAQVGCRSFLAFAVVWSFASALFDVSIARAAVEADSDAAVRFTISASTPLSPDVTVQSLPVFVSAEDLVGDASAFFVEDADGSLPLDAELVAAAHADAFGTFSVGLLQTSWVFLFNNTGVSVATVELIFDIELDTGATILGPPIPAEVSDGTGGAVASGFASVTSTVFEGGVQGPTTNEFELQVLSQILPISGVEPSIVDSAAIAVTLAPGDALAISALTFVQSAALVDGVATPVPGPAGSRVLLVLLVSGLVVLAIAMLGRDVRVAHRA